MARVRHSPSRSVAGAAGIRHRGQFIGGSWRPSTGQERFDVVNPATTQSIGAVARGTIEDVDAAVVSAIEALRRWSTSSLAERRDLLLALADGIETRAAEMAALITAEMGAPRDNALATQTLLPARVMRAYADLLDTMSFTETTGNSMVVWEPVGVVGAITPWNYPLYQICTKLGAALAAGCTVVWKPSETTPFDAQLFAEIAVDAGLVPGVLNIVTGSGPVVGEALARHPGVDMISFTGSTQVGRRVGELAAQTVKRVALELGGKSASLVLPSAKLREAVAATVDNVLFNTGQTCTAWTRLLVDAPRYEQAVEIAADLMRRQQVGDPTHRGTHIGPLATAAQRDKVRSLIHRGLAEGARLVTGGAEQPDGVATGWYVRPTLFADVTPGMTVAREEIFGPVLVAMRYQTVDEAVQIANDSAYSLAGAVWAASDTEALTVARQLQVGRVDLNGAPFNPLAPTGGVKQSGTGRELGVHGIREFCELKAIQFPARSDS